MLEVQYRGAESPRSETLEVRRSELGGLYRPPWRMLDYGSSPSATTGAPPFATVQPIRQPFALKNSGRARTVQGPVPSGLEAGNSSSDVFGLRQQPLQVQRR